MTDVEALSYFYTKREEIEEIKYLIRPFANLLGVYFSPSIERANVIVLLLQCVHNLYCDVFNMFDLILC